MLISRHYFLLDLEYFKHQVYLMHASLVLFEVVFDKDLYKYLSERQFFFFN